MAFVRGAAVVFLCALFLVGCGLGGDEQADEITAEQLAIMVLPQEEFDGGAGLVLDTEDAGPVSAREAADSTVDLEDDASDLRRAGWADGYELNYSVANRGAVLARGQGLFGVGSSVDLFDTETSARAQLLKEIQGYERYRGKKREGVRLVRFETFEVDIGDEGWGVEFTMRGQATLHGTGVFFRSGRVVASVGYSRGDRATMRDEAIKAGRALESRIERALAGELDAEPVPVPREVPEPTQAQLAKMTLAVKDLPSGAFLTDEGRERGDDSVTFFRHFDVRQTMIGGSHLMFLRAETQVFETPAAAQLMMRYISSPKGRDKFAEGVLRGFRRVAGARGRNVSVAALPGARGNRTGIVVTFDLPTGRFRTATVVVRSGRKIAIVSGFCTAQAVHPRDLPPLGERARKRLASIPV
jgi:hypothetical protein